jgi:hypothetical protein
MNPLAPLTVDEAPPSWRSVLVTILVIALMVGSGVLGWAAAGVGQWVIARHRVATTDRGGHRPPPPPVPTSPFGSS